MATLGQNRVIEILKILKAEKGKAKFGDLFVLMSRKYGLNRKTLSEYLEALKTSGKIDYHAVYRSIQEDEIPIRLTE